MTNTTLDGRPARRPLSVTLLTLLLLFSAAGPNVDAASECTAPEAEAEAKAAPGTGEAPDAEGCAPSGVASCNDLASDILDVDNDLLSDRVEICFLHTDPRKADTDGDGIIDGLDGSPGLSDTGVPLTIQLSEVNEVHEAANDGCDPDFGLWDPYFDVFGYDIPTLGENIRLSFVGWTKDNHQHNAQRNQTVNFVAVNEGGTGDAKGNAAKFNLDPDLTKWNGGLRELDLFLTFGVMLVDGDGDRYHDYMDFNIQSLPILALGPKNDKVFKSGHAYDSNTQHIHCQAEIRIKPVFGILTEEILDVAAAKLQSKGELIQCSHRQLANCVPDGSWNA